MSHPLATVSLTTVLAAGLCMPLWGQAAPQPDSLVPQPDLRRMEPAVQEHLSQARDDVVAVLSTTTSAETRAGALGDLGRTYLAYELLEAARSAFEEATRLAPEALDWSYYLAVLDEQDGLADAAADRFTEILARRPGWLPAEIRLARADLSRGEIEAAESRFRAILEVRPGTAAALYGLAQIAILDRQPEAAVELLLEVTTAQPKATAASYQLGLAYRMLGDRDRARDLLARQGREPVRFEDPLMDDLATLVQGTSIFTTIATHARNAGDLDTAIRAYEVVIARDPAQLDARLALADVLVEKGETEAAVEQLQEVVLRDPASVMGHYNLGTLLGRLGERSAATERLESALALDPDHADAHVNLAGLLATDGRFADAASHYESALRLDPQDRQSRIQRALVWTRLERSQEAIADLADLRVRAPGDPDVGLALGQALAFAGRDIEAREVLSTIDPSIDAVAGSNARYQLALIALRAGDDASARGHLEEALALNPQLAEAHVRLASLDGRQGRFSAAADHFAAALEIAPGDLESRLGRTVALLLAERYGEALEHLEASIAAEPDNPQLRDTLARLLATCPEPALRDGTRALALARTVIQTAPSFEHARTVAMALAELGRFGEAASWQQRIIDNARRAGRTDLVTALLAHLELYRRGEPVRAPWLGG